MDIDINYIVTQISDMLDNIVVIVEIKHKGKVICSCKNQAPFSTTNMKVPKKITQSSEAFFSVLLKNTSDESLFGHSFVYLKDIFNATSHPFVFFVRFEKVKNKYLELQIFPESKPKPFDHIKSIQKPTKILKTFMPNSSLKLKDILYFGSNFGSSEERNTDSMKAFFNSTSEAEGSNIGIYNEKLDKNVLKSLDEDENRPINLDTPSMYQSELTIVNNFKFPGEGIYTGLVKKRKKMILYLAHSDSGFMKYPSTKTTYIGGFINGKKFSKSFTKKSIVSNLKNDKIFVFFKDNIPIETVDMEIEYADGSYYKGKFIHNSKNYKVLDFNNFIKNGLGTFFNVHNSSVYVGRFKNNCKEGIGILEYIKTGERFIGSFKNGFSNGKGSLKKLDGSLYTGMFRNGKKSGKGSLFLPSGYKLKGWFQYYPKKQKEEMKNISIEKSEHIDLYNLKIVRKHFTKLLKDMEISHFESNLMQSKSESNSNIWERVIDIQALKTEIYALFKIFLSHSKNPKTRNYLEFFKGILKQNTTYLNNILRIFSNFINMCYDKKNKNVSKKQKIGFHDGTKKKHVHSKLFYFKSDVYLFSQFIQKLIISFIPAQNRTNQMKKDLGFAINDFIHKEIYDILFPRYQLKFEEKQMNIDQKISSILHVLRKKKKQEIKSGNFGIFLNILKNKYSEKFSTSFDQALLKFLPEVIELKNEIFLSQQQNINKKDGKKRKPLENVDKDIKICNKAMKFLDLKFQKVIENTCHSFKKAIIEILKKFELYPFQIKSYKLQKKECIFKLRTKIKSIRICMFAKYFESVLFVFQNVLESFLEYKNSKINKNDIESHMIINYLSKGYNFICPMKYQIIENEDLEILSNFYISIDNLLLIIFKASYEQTLFINKSIEKRITIIKTLLNSYFLKQHEELIIQIIDVITILNIGTRKIRIDKVKRTEKNLRKLMKQKLSKIQNKMMNIIFSLFESIKLLSYTKSYPLSISTIKKDLFSQLNCVNNLFINDYLKEKYKSGNKNENLFSFFTNMLDFIKHQFTTKKEEEIEKDYSIVQSSKEKLRVLLLIVERLKNLKVLKFERWSLFFELLNYLTNEFDFFINVYKQEIKPVLKFSDWKNYLLDNSKNQDQKKLETLIHQIDYIQNFYQNGTFFGGLKFCDSLKGLEKLLKVVILKLELLEFKNININSNTFIRKEFHINIKNFESNIISNISENLYQCIDNFANSFIYSDQEIESLKQFFFESSFSLSSIGVRESFIPKENSKNYIFSIPYHQSILTLKKIVHKKSVLEKIELLQFFDKVLQSEMEKISGRSGPFEEDDILPLVLYALLVVNQIPSIDNSENSSHHLCFFAEYEFLKDWVDTPTKMMSRFDAFIKYVSSLTPYAQNIEGHLLTILGNIYSPLNYLIIQEIKFLQKVKNKINYWWLISILNYVYCEIGFMNNDNNQLYLESYQHSNKKLIEILKMKYHQYNNLLQNIGFYIRLDSTDGRLYIIFRVKYSPDVYKKISELISKDFKNYITFNK